MTSSPEPGYYVDHLGETRWWDGQQWGKSQSEYQMYKSPGTQPRRSKVKWILISVGSLVSVLLLLTFGVDRWEKVIEPEHPETFSTVEVDSGFVSVEMDSKNPCWVGQPWYDCIDEYVSSYNHACADRMLDEPSAQLCDEYGDMIKEMKMGDWDEWSVVDELGTWGDLGYSPIMEYEQVSNNDYQPAKTREAVCILWVFVECKWHGQNTEESDGQTNEEQQFKFPWESSALANKLLLQ